MSISLTVENCYPKKELLIDATTFTATSALTSFFRHAVFLSPATGGLLSTACANAAAAHTARALCKHARVSSQFLRSALLISAIALAALSLPWALQALSLQSIATINLDIAIGTAALHLAAKIGTFVAINSLFPRQELTPTLPSTSEHVCALSHQELIHIRNYLTSFPSRRGDIALSVYHALHSRFQRQGLGQIPLTDFSDLGKWTVRDLKNLRDRDLSNLPLSKRMELNQLFLSHNLAPQTRPYQAGELPKIDPMEIARSGSLAKAQWAHLAVELGTTSPHNPLLSKLFYKHQLPPAGDEWIEIDAPLSASAIGKMQAYQIGWYQTYYTKNSSKWKTLPSEVKAALNCRFSKALPLQPAQPPPLKGRTSKSSSWQLTLAGTALGFLATAIYYTANYSAPPPPAVSLAHLNTTALVTDNATLMTCPIVAKTALVTRSLLPLGTTALATDNATLMTCPAVSEEVEIADMLGPQMNATHTTGLQKLSTPPLQSQSTDLPTFTPLSTVAPLAIFTAVTLAWWTKRVPTTQAPSSPLPLGDETQPSKKLDREKFMTYCKEFEVAYPSAQAWSDAREGLGLLQQLRKGQHIDKSTDNVRKICWGMMAHHITEESGFEHGTFVVDDPNYSLFNTLCDSASTYGRLSTHFQERAIAKKGGKGQGYSHFGIDIDHLPPNMRTVLFGMIETKGQKPRTYIKCEPWGADFCINTVEKARHLLYHSVDLLSSLYRRAMGTNQTDVDRKEHMPPKDLEQIEQLIAPLQSQVGLSIDMSDLKKWGFAQAVPLLEKAGGSTTDRKHAKKIENYLIKLKNRFGGTLFERKGNEVLIAKSIMEYDPDYLTSAEANRLATQSGPSEWVYV